MKLFRDPYKRIRQEVREAAHDFMRGPHNRVLGPSILDATAQSIRDNTQSDPSEREAAADEFEKIAKCPWRRFIP